MATIKDGETTGKTAQILCLRCKFKTNHAILYAVDWSEHDDEFELTEYATHQTVRCMGCDVVSFRSVLSDSQGSFLDHRDEIVVIESERLYPERSQHSIVDESFLSGSVHELPPLIKSVYQETIEAVRRKLLTLAGIGIRAVLEVACKDLKVKGNTLLKRVDELERQSLVTPAGVQILHGIRLLGNDVAHTGKAPTEAQLGAALSVINHLLLGVYVLPKKARILPKLPSKEVQLASTQVPKGKSEGSR